MFGSATLISDVSTTAKGMVDASKYLGFGTNTYFISCPLRVRWRLDDFCLNNHALWDTILVGRYRTLGIGW